MLPSIGVIGVLN